MRETACLVAAYGGGVGDLGAGNYLDGSIKGKAGVAYPQHGAFALETQACPTRLRIAGVAPSFQGRDYSFRGWILGSDPWDQDPMLLSLLSGLGLRELNSVT